MCQHYSRTQQRNSLTSRDLSLFYVACIHYMYVQLRVIAIDLVIN